MPLIKKFDDIEFKSDSDGIKFKNLITKEDLVDSRVTLNYFELSAQKNLAIKNSENDLMWIQILSGSINIEDNIIDHNKIIFIKGTKNIDCGAIEPSNLVITKILNYKIHEKTPTDNFEQATNIINWGNEPILKSEHDDRKRVYLLSETLADTDSVKGELIIYPKNTSCPEHYHVGAEHYQFLTEGNVVAVLDGKEYELSKYDVLYNFENENHWFYTKNSNCEFVEFFIPGEAKTIWTQTTNVCTWSPIGTDINGKKPSRHIEKHVHGEGKNI